MLFMNNKRAYLLLCTGLVVFLPVIRAGGCCSKQTVSEDATIRQEQLSRLVVLDESVVPAGRPAFDGGSRDFDVPKSHAEIILEPTASPVSIFPGDEAVVVSQNTPEISSTEKSRRFLPKASLQDIVDELVAHKKGENLNRDEGYESDNEDEGQDDAIEWRGHRNRNSHATSALAKRTGPHATGSLAPLPKEADFNRIHHAHSDSKELLREVLVRTNLSGLKKRQGVKFSQKKVYAIFRKNKKAEPWVPQDDVRTSMWSKLLASFIPAYYIDEQQ